MSNLYREQFWFSNLCFRELFRSLLLVYISTCMHAKHDPLITFPTRLNDKSSFWANRDRSKIRVSMNPLYWYCCLIFRDIYLRWKPHKESIWMRTRYNNSLSSHWFSYVYKYHTHRIHNISESLIPPIHVMTFETLWNGSQTLLQVLGLLIKHICK